MSPFLSDEPFLYGEAVNAREAVTANLPGYRVDHVSLIGEGQDNRAFEVNGDLIVRFGKRPDPAELEREARLLAFVASVAPVPVPAPAFVDPARGCLAYRRLPGMPLLDLPPPRPATAIAPVLGDLLAALHAVPAAGVRGLVEVDDQPLEEWRSEAASLYAAVAGQVPQALRPSVETFLGTAPPPRGDATVFSHNDLGIEHVLVDPASSEVTGVIDWTDAALVDPACDFGLILRDLGWAAFDAAAGERGALLRERALFYARCSVIEDLAYGVDKYVRNALAAIERLF